MGVCVHAEINAPLIKIAFTFTTWAQRKQSGHRLQSAVCGICRTVPGPLGSERTCERSQLPLSRSQSKPPESDIFSILPHVFYPHGVQLHIKTQMSHKSALQNEFRRCTDEYLVRLLLCFCAARGGIHGTFACFMQQYTGQCCQL